jgi:hypothetical protein
MKLMKMVDDAMAMSKKNAFFLCIGAIIIMMKIDDTDYVIDGFVKAGGIGILHSDVNETISKLKFYCEEYVLPPHSD